MVWALIRLYDFRLTRDGDDLHSTYGLLTRVSATIPLRRIQTLTIREGPLHRLLGRASVRVETAGGAPGAQGGTRQREWLAPIILKDRLPGFLIAVLPGVDLSAVEWRSPEPPAYRRALRIGLFLAAPMTLAIVWLLTRWSFLFLPLPFLWALVGSRKSVQYPRLGSHRSRGGLPEWMDLARDDRGSIHQDSNGHASRVAVRSALGDGQGANRYCRRLRGVASRRHPVSSARCRGRALQPPGDEGGADGVQVVNLVSEILFPPCLRHTIESAPGFAGCWRAGAGNRVRAARAAGSR